MFREEKSKDLENNKKIINKNNELIFDPSNLNEEDATKLHFFFKYYENKKKKERKKIFEINTGYHVPKWVLDGKSELDEMSYDETVNVTFKLQLVRYTKLDSENQKHYRYIVSKATPSAYQKTFMSSPSLKFRRAEKLGQGMFGIVYTVLGTLKSKNGKMFFIKSEKNKVKDKAKVMKVINLVGTDKDYFDSVKTANKYICNFKFMGIKKTTFVTDTNNKYTSAYTVSKRIFGKDLSDYLQRKGYPIIDQKFSLTALLQLTLSLLLKLKEIHDKKVLHNDIKPANIMVSQSNNGTYQGHFIDFGLCTTFGKYEKAAVGTPLWLAPEQIVSKGYITDPKRDIYSLGMVFRVLWGDKNLVEQLNSFTSIKNFFSELFTQHQTGNGIELIFSDHIVNFFNNDLQNSENFCAKSKVSAILLGLSHPQPEQRKTIDEAIEVFTQVQGLMKPSIEDSTNHNIQLKFEKK